MTPPQINERVDAAKQHLTHSIEWKGDVLGVLEMRRHYSSYFRGLPHIKPFRMILVTSHDHEELFATLETIRAHYANFIFSGKKEGELV